MVDNFKTKYLKYKLKYQKLFNSMYGGNLDEFRY